MLSSLKIKNFQSLHDVTLDLAKFTVIVGPSSSGKTAVTRALRVLFENSRGTPYVTHGAKTSVISAQWPDRGVRLERGGTTGEYKVLNHGTVARYTKLAGATPEAVRAVLGVADTSLVFASQFDRPYLLDETGATVARVLGELTNVSIIFDAVKESNRRKLEASSLLKTRESDFAEIITQAQSFKTLPGRVKALNEAEELFSQARVLNYEATKLDELIDKFNLAQAQLAALGARVVELPDFKPVEQAYSALEQFKTLIANLVRHLNEVKVLKSKDELLTEKVNGLKMLYYDTLVAAGTCPMCAQSTKELSVT